jgi:hypothetical protein
MLKRILLVFVLVLFVFASQRNLGGNYGPIGGLRGPARRPPIVYGGPAYPYDGGFNGVYNGGYGVGGYGGYGYPY